MQLPTLQFAWHFPTRRRNLGFSRALDSLLTSIHYAPASKGSVIRSEHPVNHTASHHQPHYSQTYKLSLKYSYCGPTLAIEVSWCFQPSQPQRITSWLTTNFTLSPSYLFHKSSYHKSCFFSLFIFHGHSTWEPASGRVTYFFLQAYTGTMCLLTGKIGRGFRQMQVNGPEVSKLTRKKSLAVSVACMAIY